LVGGYGDGGKDADDGDYDHQFNEGKPLMSLHKLLRMNVHVWELLTVTVVLRPHVLCHMRIPKLGGT
jgi:hypothetical protein